MKQLNLHIEYLLRHHECVILPGVGAFLKLRHSSYMDSVSGVIIPPSEEICFNASISSNDGLIAHSISRRERIGYEEALRRLNDATEELLTMLREEHEVTIGEIGTLLMDSEGKISFRQRYNAASFAAMLGYYPAQIADEPERVPAVADDNRFSHHYRPDKYYYIAINKKFAKAAAMFVCVVTVCLSLFLPLSSDSLHQDYASVVPIGSVQKAITEVTREKSAAPAAKSASGPRIVKESECTGKHYLIVGTFRTLEESNTFLEQNECRDGGIEIIEGARTYKISAYSSSDRAEVSSAMSSPEMKERFGQSWIWDADL